MTNGHDAYFESKVLSADPMELIQILYEAALECIQKARRHLQEGNIIGRSKEISRAVAILTELELAVDRGAGAHLSANLIELYDYLKRRLIEANIRQIEVPLAEASTLLGTLLEGWLECKKSAVPRLAEVPIRVQDSEPEYSHYDYECEPAACSVIG